MPFFLFLGPVSIPWLTLVLPNPIRPSTNTYSWCNHCCPALILLLSTFIFYQRHVSLHFAQFLFVVVFFCQGNFSTVFFLNTQIHVKSWSTFTTLLVESTPATTKHWKHTDLILNPILFPSFLLSRPLVIYRVGDFLFFSCFYFFFRFSQVCSKRCSLNEPYVWLCH